MNWLRTSYLLGRVMGIPIRVHFSLLLFAPFLAWSVSRGGLPILLSLLAVVLLFASVLLHELGHCWVALRKGCSVRQILLLPIGGIAQLNALSDNPKDEIHIAIAGPIVSLLLAAAGWSMGFGFYLLGWELLGTVAFALGAINLVLALFNLLPSFPMDGGRVLRAWMTPKVGYVQATRIAAGLGQGLAIVFGIIGLFGLRGVSESPSPILVLIAVFIFFSAKAEYRSAQLRELQRQAARTPPPPPWAPFLFRGVPPSQQGPEGARPVDDEVVVGPSPYQRDKER